MKLNHTHRTAERGFSLIELMIVIAIIGILIAVGVTGWKAAVKAANEAAAIKTLQNDRRAANALLQLSPAQHVWHV